jgi:hypothetical protein
MIVVLYAAFIGAVMIFMYLCGVISERQNK